MEENEENSFKSNFKSHALSMRSLTWNIDKFDQFDYDSTELSEDFMKISGPCFIARCGDIVSEYKKLEMIPEGGEALCQIRQQKEGLFLDYPQTLR